MFTANGSPKHLTECILRYPPARNQLIQQEETSENRNKILFLPYVKGVSEKIEHICFPLGVKVISKSEHTLRQSLMKVKTMRPEEKRRGMIYEVPCADCNCVYIGETGWFLEMRLKEHTYAVKTGVKEWHSCTCLV